MPIKTGPNVSPDSVDTLINKGIDADNNTIVNIGNAEFDTNTADTMKFAAGVYLDPPSVVVTSDGATITLTLEQDGGGDLRLIFLTGEYNYDATPATTISLTAGTDTVPQRNYVYIPTTTKVLTVSTSGFPVADIVRVADVLVQSASKVQSDGALKMHAWTDHMASATCGHLSHVNGWIRSQPATWIDGVATTPTITVNGGAVDNVDIATTSGNVRQLHSHAFPAFDTAVASHIDIVNHTTAYTEISDLNAANEDDAGNAIGNNKWTNLVLWGVVSEDTGDCHLFVNLPSAFHNSASAATTDAEKLSNYTIPREYLGTGFLIARLTLKYTTASSGTWTLEENLDLRASGAVGGSGVGATEFSDTVFAIVDNADATKKIAFEASGITTGTTRTVTMPDGNVDMSGGTDGDILTVQADGSLAVETPAGGGGQTTFDAVVAPSGGDYTDIESAIDAGKVSIKVMPGTYTLTGTIDCDVDGLHIEGSGWTTIVKLANTTDLDIFLVTADNVTIKNLKIDGNGANNTLGAAVKLVGANYFTLDRVWIFDPEEYGVEAITTMSAGCSITNNLFTGTRYTRVIYDDAFLDNSIITNNNINATCSSAGITIVSDDLVFSNNYVEISHGSTAGLGFNCYNSSITGNTFVLSGSCSNAIGMGGTKNVFSNNIYTCATGTTSMFRSNGSDNNISGNVFEYASGSTGCGIEAFGDNLVISGNRFLNIREEAVHVKGDYCTVIGNGIEDCGQETNNTFSAIYINTSVNCTISGNNIKSSSANRNKYGVEESSTSDNYNVITGNMIIGASSGGVLLLGASSIAKENGQSSPVEEKGMVYVDNTSGGQLVLGDVVTLKAVAAGNEFTTTTTQGDDLVLGMVTETIADTASGYVQTIGKTVDLKVDGTTDIAVGDFIGTFTTAKIGMKASAGDMAFAIALEAYTTNDSSGVIDALLITPRKI